ncbi:hypothetical protein QUF55_06350 [Clostridiaceae bacterium HSG29]|nr:hypothetical protein [Clostridiaceae bacterium HSG29]
MPNDIMEKILIAKDIAVTIITVIVGLYVIYRIIDYLIRRRETTLEVIANSFCNYESYIQVDSNMNYLKKFVTNIKVFKSIEKELIEEQDNFKKTIDKYTHRKSFEYYIFCEYKEIESGNRGAKLLIVKLSLLGRIHDFKIVDKNGIELEYLKTI